MKRVTSTEILTAILGLSEGMSDAAWEALGKVVAAEIAFEDAQAQREMLERHSECGKGDAPTPVLPGGYH